MATGSSNQSQNRSKVALKPGRSLMDWIRLTHSSTDLSSTGGNVHVVTAEELKRHCTKDDAWICIQGKVYNITHYLEYHPGGVDELMRGAGKDATDLFNEIHRWVNVESMLKKCFIGPMSMPSLWLRKSSVTNLQPSSPAKTEESKTKLTWRQTENSIHITLRLNQPIKLHHIIADLREKNLLLTINLKDNTYKFNMELEGSVIKDYAIEIKEANMVIISFSKQSNESWAKLGSPLPMHNTLFQRSIRNLCYRKCKLMKKEFINHNICLLLFELPSSTKMSVPVGCHVNIRDFINDVEVIRSYTPVVPSLTNDCSIDVNNIYLMIKIYPNGTLTQKINQLNIGEFLDISDHMGDFTEDILNIPNVIVMLAAGTGITPMIRIINLLLTPSDTTAKSLILIFFNKTEKDIIWNDELCAVVEKDERFKVYHVLSEPDAEWYGATGFINKNIVEDLIPAEIQNSGTYFCVCGPIAFVNSTQRTLRELDITDSNMWLFCG